MDFHLLMAGIKQISRQDPRSAEIVHQTDSTRIRQRVHDQGDLVLNRGMRKKLTHPD